MATVIQHVHIYTQTLHNSFHFSRMIIALSLSTISSSMPWWNVNTILFHFKKLWQALTCCGDGAAAHSVACSAGIRCGKGIAQPVCPASCAPAGWRLGIAVAEASGGRLDRSLGRARSCWGTGSSMCGRMACPWAATEAAGRCGTPAHHPLRPDIQTGDFPDLHDTVHIPYTPAPTIRHPPMETAWAPSWPDDLKKLSWMSVRQESSFSDCTLYIRFIRWEANQILPIQKE